MNRNPGTGETDRTEIRVNLLNEVVESLLSSNRFYQQKLSAAGVRLPFQSSQDFSKQVPFTTKQELVEDQRLHPPFGTNLTYPLERYTRFHQTSGTTGRPMRWLDTTEDWQHQLDNWNRVYEAAGVTKEDRVYFSFSFGPFLGFWSAFEAACQRGCLCIPGGGLTSTSRLRAILENGVTVLCCTPTYALRLARTAREEGIDLSASKVRLLMVAGEPGGSIPSTRERIQNEWGGARVFDHHGMTEVGPASYECPERPGVLHIIESAFHTEVVDPGAGTPVDPGKKGELVLTTLRRKGSPVLRYRTGDLVCLEDSDRCVCGTGDLTLVGGILGRSDDLVIVRGVNLYPGAVDEAVQRFTDVSEYRVEIVEDRAMTELRVLVEPAPDCADCEGLKVLLEQTLRERFNLRIPVKILEPGQLPRFEMKTKRWIRT